MYCVVEMWPRRGASYIVDAGSEYTEARTEMLVSNARDPLENLPSIVRSQISDRRLGFVERQFDAYGGVGICVTNAVPGIRGLMTIVAGVSEYPRRRFLLASTLGNCLYVALLVGAARGIRSVASMRVTRVAFRECPNTIRQVTRAASTSGRSHG